MGSGAPWGSIIQSASAGLQAVVGARSIGNAQRAQQQGIQAANDLRQRQYAETQSYLEPYRRSGIPALEELNKGLAPGGDFNRSFTMEDYKEDPGFKFRLDEGLKALERSGSARGMLLSGAQQKGIANYSQGLASQEFNNAYNRYRQDTQARYSNLMGLAGLGAGVSGQAAGLSQKYGDDQSQGVADIYNSVAAGIMAKYRNWQTQDSRAAGAWSGGMGGGGGGTSNAGGNWMSMFGGG